MDITQHPFRQEEIQQLQHYRDGQHDGRLKIRFIGLLMLAEAFSVEQVATLIGRSAKTVQLWGTQYLTKGIESLNRFIISRSSRI